MPMPDFLSLSDTAVPLDAEAFAAAKLAGPVSYLAAPGGVAPLSNYSRFDAPNLARRRGIFSEMAYAYDPVTIFRMRNARFFGTSIFFTNEDGRVVKESVNKLTVPTHTLAELIAAARLRTVKPVRLLITEQGMAEPAEVVRGKYILASSIYTRNYYHWHVDLLMGVSAAWRLGILGEYKVLLSDRSEFIMRSLQYYGVEETDTVLLPTDRAVQFEEIMFSTTVRNFGFRMNPAIGQVFDPIVAGMVKAARGTGDRRIFVSRGTSDRRLLVNRAATEAAFAAAGFEVVDPGALSYDEQVALFDGAGVVVGEHGGALGNIGFCRPGALVVELFNPLHHDLCYLSLAEVRELYHRIFVGEMLGDAGPMCEWSIDAQTAVRFVGDAIEKWRWSRENLYVAKRKRLKSVTPEGQPG